MEHHTVTLHRGSVGPIMSLYGAPLAASVKQSLRHSAEAHLNAKVIQWNKISVKVSRTGKRTPAEVGVCMHAQAQCGSRAAGWESAGN